MGLEFIRKKGESFNQQRNEARSREFDQRTLFSGAKRDEVFPMFHCQLEKESMLIERGQTMVLRRVSDHEVQVLFTNQKIGFVLPQDVPNLVTKMVGIEFLSVQVIEPPGWEGVFTVRPTKPLGNR